MWAKASKVDVLYRKLLLTKFFTKGWGSVEILKRICEFSKVISDRSMCKHLVDGTYPIFIDKNEKRGDCRLIEGHFLSPFAKYMKGIMPKEVETARFQFLLPTTWNTERRPVCIHLAGTGDHGFWRRRTIMARPLLKEHGIGSIILENPFYGLRKPKEQLRSSLLNVSDLFVMGGALILETLALLHWCEKEGYGPLGVSGVSMGGHMATLAATNWHKPLALIPCLSWSNATPIFTQGVLSGAIPWRTLASEYVYHSEYEAEILRKLMKCPQYDAFRLGQEFAVNFPESIEELGDIKLKSGFASAKRKQNAAQSSASPSNPVQNSTLHTTVTDTSGLDQQFQECNSAGSKGPTDIRVAETHYMRAQSNQCQRDGVKAMNDSAIYSSSDQINQINHNAIDQSTHENSASTILPKNQSVPNLTAQPVVSIYTQSIDNTSATRLKLDSSSVGTAELNVNQTLANSESEKSAASLGRNMVNSSGSTQTCGQRTSDLKTGVKVDTSSGKTTTSSRTEDGSASSKKSARRNKWKPTKEEYTKLRDDALHFMEGVMDSATFVGNFSKPIDPELVVTILAKQDAYIPWHRMQNLAEMWPGMEVRYINSGHVAAILFQQHQFRRAIKDAFQKMEKKYNGVYPEES